MQLLSFLDNIKVLFGSKKNNKNLNCRDLGSQVFEKLKDFIQLKNIRWGNYTEIMFSDIIISVVDFFKSIC